ncbi:MAG: flagellar protein [Sporomusaceae bacterium]|nr:flagellar protein [Sporomusaceae bacterium]
MNLTNCIECGGLCVENPSKLCNNCIRAEEEAEDKVAEYLRNADRATLDDINKATGVKHKIILRMLKRGRIFSDAIISYPCETCGAPINEGRVCTSCSKNIVGQVKHEEWKPEKRPESTRKDEKMYTKDIIQRK